MRFGCILMLMFLALAKAETPGDDTFGALRGLVAPEKPGPAFAGKFEPRPGETIVFLGGTDVLQEQFTGVFEALMSRQWADKDLKFRNLAWQADTVYRQQRPQYFYDAEHSDKQPGSTPDQRKRTTADVVIVRFGKMESLDGVEALPKFKEAYGKFLDRALTLTPRVIVAEPVPFYPAGPAKDLVKERTTNLRAYQGAIREVAAARKLLVLSSEPLIQKVEASPDTLRSYDGLHPMATGQREIALEFFRQLSGVEGAIPEKDPIRASIAEKNRVWLQYYRPTNWAFLYGDRQHVPSSRDHEDPEKRWFPFEIERALPLIQELEKTIHEQAAKRS